MRYFLSGLLVVMALGFMAPKDLEARCHRNPCAPRAYCCPPPAPCYVCQPVYVAPPPVVMVPAPCYYAPCHYCPPRPHVGFSFWFR